jgi:hypothetical protein
MGTAFSKKLRMDRGFGNGSHKCPVLPPVQTNNDNAGLSGDISTSSSGIDKQSVQLSGNTDQNASAPLRGNVNQTQQMQQATISPLSVSASATKKFNFNGSNALIRNSSEYTIQPSSTLSNKNTKIILSWVDPKLSNQAMPSIDCDLTQSPDTHLGNISKLIADVNVIYVSYTDNNHIQLLLSGDICDNIYLVAENKLVMNLTAVDIKDINKSLTDNITVVSDLTDELKKEKKPICEKMTEYFTNKMKTFAKIILLMNYCYLKLNSIKNGGLCYMPPDDDMDELDDNFNLFTPSSIKYDKIEVYDNDLIDNNKLLKHIDKLNIREKLLLPDKNFATIREKVLEGQFEKYREKISLEDKIIKDKLQKIVENKKFITNIELIHEKDCKTNGGIFLKDANEIANYGLYSEDVSNTSWLNVYKTLCCSIFDKLTKLKTTFIEQSFKSITKKEPKSMFNKTEEEVNSWTDKDMTTEQIDSLDIEITTEIEKIIIEIDRGFLGLYLMPTTSPARVKKEDEILKQAEEIKKKRGSKI